MMLTPFDGDRLNASVTLALDVSAEDLAAFDALPSLPRELPEDWDAGELPDVTVTDRLSGKAYTVCRWPCDLGCGCAALAFKQDA